MTTICITFDRKSCQQAHGRFPDKPKIQAKMYLIGNSTPGHSLKETLTVCSEAPQGSLLKK